MLKMLFAMSASVIILAACASPAPAPSAPPLPTAPAARAFDPSACVDRRFAVYFENTTLSAEAAEAIEAVERSLQGCTIQRVRVVGFAEHGEPDESMEASQERADAVAAFLQRTTQWPASAYEVVARGDARALTQEGEERPMRRRARVHVTAVAPQ